jgi:hypothetical protein
MMRRLLLVTLLAAFAVCPAFAQNAPAPQQPPRKTFDMGGVIVTLPTGVKVEKRRGPDFDLFYFTTAEKDAKGKPRQILFAYIGFAPGFPNAAPKGTPETKETINGYTTRSCRWKSKEGTTCRESLVSTGRNDWAKYVHFIYTDLTPAEAKTADEIIATVHTVPAKPPASRP